MARPTGVCLFSARPLTSAHAEDVTGGLHLGVVVCVCSAGCRVPSFLGEDAVDHGTPHGVGLVGRGPGRAVAVGKLAFGAGALWG